MELRFSKYHGTGNDFILLDNRAGAIALPDTAVARLCHRRFGIGADGLMLLETAAGADFRMVYYNSDGRQSSMCGNGGRCLVAFAARLGLVSSQAQFTATDGEHTARIDADGIVHLHMNDVDRINRVGNDVYILDTGSPHYVKLSGGVDRLDVPAEGRAIRYSAAYKKDGINVNFLERTAGGLFVRTYERGVEDETLSCGTGVTAAAIASVAGEGAGEYDIPVGTPGGALRVSFTKDEGGRVRDVILSGPAVHVFDGVAQI